MADGPGKLEAFECRYIVSKIFVLPFTDGRVSRSQRVIDQYAQLGIELAHVLNLRIQFLQRF